jgi:hypothetical protein
MAYQDRPGGLFASPPPPRPDRPPGNLPAMRWFGAYSPDKPVAMGGHAFLTAVYNGSVAAFVLYQRRSGQPVPERIPAGDLALLSVGTYKLSRLVTKDRIMSFARAPFTRLQGESDRPGEVVEEPRGHGVQHAVGELLTCPYCLSQWIGTAFLLTYLREPRLARTVAAAFTIVAGSDLLQETWVAVDKRA